MRYGEADWDAVRAEYVAGGVGQRKLAEKHGLSYSALRQRAGAEGWVALRREAMRAAEKREEESAAEEGPSGGAAEKREKIPAKAVKSPGAKGDTGVALRLRRKLLNRLEKMADEIPEGAVTEYKTQDDSAVKLFKLRDLTAAYKELAGDIPAEDGEAARVIIDV